MAGALRKLVLVVQFVLPLTFLGLGASVSGRPATYSWPDVAGDLLLVAAVFTSVPLVPPSPHPFLVNPLLLAWLGFYLYDDYREAGWSSGPTHPAEQSVESTDQSYGWEGGDS